jgi:hypothetical protein
VNAISRRHQGVVLVDLPGLQLRNPLNGSHRHWRVEHRRRAMVATVVGLAVKNRVREVPLPVVVTVTRVANSQGLDPHDGLPASCKQVVDCVARAYGIDDRDARITWQYDQRRGKGYGCQIRIEARP